MSPDLPVHVSRAIAEAHEEAGIDCLPASLVTLRTLLDDPASLELPRAVMPRLAWAGRSTLLAGREKGGKSTLTSAGIAAVSSGRPFLGEPTVAGDVLLLALEEAEGDVARRLREWGADPDRVHILPWLEDPFGDLEAAVAGLRPVLVVVDTLAAFVETLALDPSNSSVWTSVMGRLTRMAHHEDGPALLLNHHARKSDGKYRDSSAIAAGVDVLLEMREGSEPGVRLIEGRGRWHVEDSSLVLTAKAGRPTFELTSRAPSLDALVLLHVERFPGASTRAVREAVEGDDHAVRAAIDRLERSGAIENRGSCRRHAWHPMSKAHTSLHTTPGVAENPRHTKATPPAHTAAVCDSKPYTPRDPHRTGRGANDLENCERFRIEASEAEEVP